MKIEIETHDALTIESALHSRLVELHNEAIIRNTRRDLYVDAIRRELASYDALRKAMGFPRGTLAQVRVWLAQQNQSAES